MSHRRIGKYEVRSELGRGTMGEVYRAFDPVLQRVVALKTMVMPLNEGDEILERFRREAHAAARLNHPNIVTVYDFGKEGPLLFMAMELLKGTDLRDALDGGELETLDARLDVMDGVLRALEYAHAEGVVHRDIKPANIHLGPGRHVKIMDFGLARVGTSEMTQEGIVLGTPNYMSPEQALGDRVDARSDLFSAGAVLYELMTGHKPFEAESTPSVLFQVVHKEAPPVSRWVPDAPGPIVEVVRRALLKDRARRFQTAGEMRSALAEARRSSTTPARPAAPPLPGPPPRVAPEPPATRLTPPPLPAHARNPDGSIPPIVRRAGPPPVVASAASSPALSAAEPAPAANRSRRSAAAIPAASGLVIVAVLAIVGLWRSGAAPPAPTPAPSAATAEVNALTGALVETQLQLARRELDDKNYASAVRQAESVLGLAAGHPEATRILEEAQQRARELEEAVEAARELAGKGDFEAASQQLARVLELDPRHPAAVDLSTRLNSLFRTRAGNAADSMRAARAQAAQDGAAQQAEYHAAAERAGAADALLARNEFAQATRAYLEARDGFQRAARAVARPAATATAAPERLAEPAEAAARPPSRGPAPDPGRSFTTDVTAVSAAAGSTPTGFEAGDVASKKAPDFVGKLLFQVVPPAVHLGDPFVVRLRLVNEGRRSVRVRSLELLVVAEGRRARVDAKVLDDRVEGQREAIVAEYSGVWREARPWALEAVLTTDRGETVRNRLRANP
jgi:serine/threonine-protein kinase